jgi:peptidoglycan hydrolase CwlO-like protein
VGACALLSLPVMSRGDLSHNLDSRQAEATQLKSLIASETRRLAATNVSVGQAQARLASLQADVNARQAQLTAVQRDIVATRNRLERLENRLHDASVALAANLVANYKDDDPDMISVVLGSHGFADMLERLQFIERIRKQDAQILTDSRTARVKVIAQTARLQRLQARLRDLTASVVRSRNQAAALQAALLTRQANQLQQRANTAARLGRVRGQISSIRRQIDRLSHPVVTAVSNDLPVDAGGMAQAPAGAPAAVKQVIAAGNAIAGLPYLYGGGHGSFHASAYDCSGSVSYALAAAGLLASPLDSTAFESWGEAGPGSWITVYANAGHAFMVVAGWRFDTSSLSQGGTRWTRAMRDTGGFVARHPSGL